MTIYEQVKEKSLPLIKMYKKDLLEHDKTDIENSPEIPFLHFTGDTGTCLVFLPPASNYPKKGEKIPYLFKTEERLRILSSKVSSVKCMRTVNRQDMILYFDGEKLTVTSQLRAEIITRKYAWKILDSWRE